MRTALVTNHQLYEYAGSELVTYDLVQALRTAGMDVTVATFRSGEPVAGHFREAGIEVVDVLREPLALRARHFDLLWGHHWPIVAFCQYELGVQARTVVRSSMSGFGALECFPTGAPGASAILFNSAENLEQQRPALPEDERDRTLLFRNGLTEEWLNSDAMARSGAIRRLAIVSNHVAPELRVVGERLASEGVNVRVYGRGDLRVRLSPDELRHVDAVITIGHSVPKALAIEVPVFCYDHFGGPGWITPENFTRAQHFNFSGRCTPVRLSPEDICGRLFGGYGSATTGSHELRERVVQEHDLSRGLNDVLSRVRGVDRPAVDPSRLMLERKLCQQYVRGAFRLPVSPHTVLDRTPPDIFELHYQPSERSGWEPQIAQFRLGEMCLARFWYGREQSLPLAGVVVPNGNLEVVAVEVVIGERLVPCLLKGLPQRDQLAPMPSNARHFACHLVELPSNQSLAVVVRLSDQTQTVIGRLEYRSTSAHAGTERTTLIE